MPSDPKRVQELFLDVVDLPLDQREAAVEAACGADAELKRRLEALLRAHDDPGSFLDAPPTRPPLAPAPERTIDSTPSLSPTLDSANNDEQELDMTRTTDVRRDIDVGTMIGGRFQLLQKIGEGGMGEVWVARQTEPVRRKVALKLIKTGMDSVAVLARFEQERQALAIMDHPNIARVLDGGMTPTGQPYFVMELVNGLPLTKFCDTAKLNTKERLQLFMPICQAVQHAHQKGVVHRDLKPANILVTMVDGVPMPKVIDFGVAKATGGKLTDESLSTQFGAVVGTLEYMSPEQTGYSGSDVDTRADIYSLGVVLYELLTGLRPIDGARLKKAGLAEMIRMIQEVEPSKPSTRLSTDDALPSLAAVRRIEPRKLTSMLRGELDWVVMKCLEKNRDRRYDTANALARDIQRYLANEMVEARPPSASYRLKKFLRRNRRFVQAASLIAIVFVAGMIGTIWGLIEARRQAEVAQRETAEAEAAQKRESEQREIAERANRQAFDALNAFTSSLMANLLGSKENLSKNDIAILEDAQKQWEVFADSKGDSESMRSIRANAAKNLGSIQYKLGLLAQAEANERKALAIRQALADEFPANNKYRILLADAAQNLGGLLRGSGRTAEADTHFRNAEKIREALALADPDNDQLALDWSATCVSMANVARDVGDWDTSRAYYLKALGILEKWTTHFPTKPQFQEATAGINWDLAFLSKRTGDFDAASGHYLTAITTFEKLAAQDLGSVYYRAQVANLHREYGVALYDQEKDEEGASQIELAVPIQRKLVSELPSVAQHQFNLARSLRDLAKVQGFLKQQQAAEDGFDESIRLFVRLTELQPTNELYQRELGLTYTMQGNLRFDEGQIEESLISYNLAITILTRVYIQNRNIVLAQRAIYRAHEYRADTLDRLGRYAEALIDRDKVLEYGPADLRDIHRFQRVDTSMRAGNIESAVNELAELSQIENKNPAHWFRFSKLYALASQALPERKEELATRAGELLRKAAELGFDDLNRLRADEDLKPLHETEVFKSVVQQLTNPTKE
jgi:serine/threonine protein kinase